MQLKQAWSMPTAWPAHNYLGSRSCLKDSSENKDPYIKLMYFWRLNLEDMMNSFFKWLLQKN